MKEEMVEAHKTTEDEESESRDLQTTSDWSPAISAMRQHINSYCQAYRANGYHHHGNANGSFQFQSFLLGSAPGGMGGATALARRRSLEGSTISGHAAAQHHLDLAVEVYPAQPAAESLQPFPVPQKRPEKRVSKARQSQGRFRTAPISFDEIREVDEEPSVPEPPAAAPIESPAPIKGRKRWSSTSTSSSSLSGGIAGSRSSPASLSTSPSRPSHVLPFSALRLSKSDSFTHHRSFDSLNQLRHGLLLPPIPEERRGPTGTFGPGSPITPSNQAHTFPPVKQQQLIASETDHHNAINNNHILALNQTATNVPQQPIGHISTVNSASLPNFEAHNVTFQLSFNDSLQMNHSSCGAAETKQQLQDHLNNNNLQLQNLNLTD